MSEPCLEWAYNALGTYLKKSGIPENDVDAFTREGITVVLMGATQQGKTSLALRLLGAQPGQIADLDKALGGGNETGRSRTRATSILRAAGSANYKKKLDELESKILKINEDLCDEVSLDLPLDGGKSTSIARVVDLIGLESATETEERKRFAERQAKKWLQRADLKLVVVRASSITDIVVGEHSYLYKKELRDLFGYWCIDPHTSFIAITWAWGDTKQETFNGKTHGELLETASSKEVHTQTASRLFDVLREEYEKETGSQQFPDVTVLPFSLPPKVDLDNPIERKKYQATEHSFEIIGNRVSKERPLVFKLKSAFAHPKKLEAELQAKIDELDSTKKEHLKEMENDKRKDKEDESYIQSTKDEIRKREKLLDKAREYPTVITRQVVSGLTENSSLNLPTIKGLRSRSPKNFPIFGSRKGSMKDCLESIIKGKFGDLRKVTSKTLRDIRNGKKARMPLRVRKSIPIEQLEQIVHTALSKAAERATRNWLESVLPDRWHKDDGWPKAQEALQGAFGNLIESSKGEIKNGISHCFESKDYFKINRLTKELETLQRDLDIQQEKMDKTNAARQARIAELDQAISTSKKKVKQYKSKLYHARKYKDYISESYVDYWNNRVAAINKSNTSELRKVELLAELSVSVELFEEITEFATQSIE